MLIEFTNNLGSNNIYKKEFLYAFSELAPLI